MPQLHPELSPVLMATWAAAMSSPSALSTNGCEMMNPFLSALKSGRLCSQEESPVSKSSTSQSSSLIHSYEKAISSEVPNGNKRSDPIFGNACRNKLDCQPDRDFSQRAVPTISATLSLKSESGYQKGNSLTPMTANPLQPPWPTIDAFGSASKGSESRFTTKGNHHQKSNHFLCWDHSKFGKQKMNGSTVDIPEWLRSDKINLASDKSNCMVCNWEHGNNNEACRQNNYSKCSSADQILHCASGASPSKTVNYPESRWRGLNKSSTDPDGRDQSSSKESAGHSQVRCSQTQPISPVCDKKQHSSVTMPNTPLWNPFYRSPTTSTTATTPAPFNPFDPYMMIYYGELLRQQCAYVSRDCHMNKATESHHHSQSMESSNVSTSTANADTTRLPDFTSSTVPVSTGGIERTTVDLSTQNKICVEEKEPVSILLLTMISNNLSNNVTEKYNFPLRFVRY